MAYYFGINTGKDEYSVTSGTSTTSKDIELVINTNANVPSVQELKVAAENLINALLRAGKAWS
jgi:hypothetical protein